MKAVTVEAFFGELKGNPYRTGRGRGSSTKVAISRAFGDLLKQVKKKQIHTIHATLTIMDVQPTEAAL
jgi:hypothetical protein